MAKSDTPLLSIKRMLTLYLIPETANSRPHRACLLLEEMCNKKVTEIRRLTAIKDERRGMGQIGSKRGTKEGGPGGRRVSCDLGSEHRDTTWYIRSRRISQPLAVSGLDENQGGTR